MVCSRRRRRGRGKETFYLISPACVCLSERERFTDCKKSFSFFFLEMLSARTSVLDLSRFKKKINLVKSKNIKIQIQIIYFSFFFLKIKIKKIWSKSKSKIKSKNKIKNLKIKIKLKRTENFNLLIIYEDSNTTYEVDSKCYYFDLNKNKK